MKLRTSLTGFTATFIAGLGIAPVSGCGGATVGDSDGNLNQTGGAGGSGGGPGAGGLLITGGWSSTGGWQGDGGAPATGGHVGAGGAVVWPSCTNPTPILGPSGEVTGFSRCGDTAIRRDFKQDCASSLPRSGTLVVPYDAGVPPQCAQDSDCVAQPHGYCTFGEWGAPTPFCEYGCVSDSDCGSGQICLCGSPVGQCVSSSCPDGGCSAPSLCATYNPNPGCPGTAFACTSYMDGCLGDSDCAYMGGTCTYVTPPGSSTGTRQCQPMSCVVGRPFLVQGRARLADFGRRSDWTSSLSPTVSSLTASARTEAAIRWTEIGLMEHASIAAFARFALELLSLGAPPSLLAATQDAMRDETIHARDAFALASAYAGAPVGPGRLSLDGSLTDRTPLDVLRTAILEGCIGETVAAVEAREALAHATDPAVREALERVAVDEQRHAELAWQLVKWVIAEGPSELRSIAPAELRRSIAEAAACTMARVPADRADAAVLRAHGVLSESIRSEIRLQVLTDVVEPCVAALLASAAHDAAALRS